MVRGGGAGTSVSYLYRDDSGIRQSNEKRQAAGLARVHGSTRIDLVRRRVGSHARRTQSTYDSAAERFTDGESAK